MFSESREDALINSSAEVTACAGKTTLRTIGLCQTPPTTATVANALENSRRLDFLIVMLFFLVWDALNTSRRVFEALPQYCYDVNAILAVNIISWLVG